MRKTIVSVLFFVLITLNLGAQQKFSPSTYIGINAGVSFCSVNFDPSIEQGLLSAPSFGILFRYVSEKHIGTQLELNYAGRGWIEKRDSIGTYTRDVKVLDIPLTAAFIAGSKKTRFAFILGPFISYRLGEKETIMIPDSRYYRDYYLKNLESNWEFGFTGGISAEWHTAIGAFGARAVYSYNLTNIFPLNSNHFYYGASRGQAIHAGLTYFFEL